VSAFTITAAEAAQLANSLEYKTRLTFSNQANRNWVAKNARLRGLPVIKSSQRNVLLDPRYTVEGASTPDRGLYNDYKHYFPVVYTVEVDRSYHSYR
jgi:hypothetical protein